MLVAAIPLLRDDPRRCRFGRDGKQEDMRVGWMHKASATRDTAFGRKHSAGPKPRRNRGCLGA